MSAALRHMVRPLVRYSYRYALVYLRSRVELPHLLNARGLIGEGAEIGVLRGQFSEILLDEWRGRCLHSVDPWKAFPAGEYRDNKNVSQAQHDALYSETERRLQRFGSRSRIVRDTSRAAAARFEDGQLDFVYIDAQHHYEAVREDIALWYPKLRPRGLLAGHDYLHGWLNGCQYGVRPAVDEFARERGLDVIVSRERPHPSWLIVV